MYTDNPITPLLGKIAYEKAQQQNYRYAESWDELPSEGKEYWTSIAVAVAQHYDYLCAREN